MDSDIETVFIKIEDDENDTENFVCNFCSMNLATMIERDQHLETHLIHQNCYNCKKPMILIGNQLYELHIPTKCKDELVRENDWPLIEPKNEVKNLCRRSERNAKPLAEQKSAVNENESKKRTKRNEKQVAEYKIAVNKNQNKEPEEKCEEVQSQFEDNSDVDVKDEPVINTDNMFTSDQESFDESPTKSPRKKSDTKSLKTYKKNPKTIPCDLCDQMFGAKQSLTSHQKKVHNKVPVHKCDICGMILKTAMYLKNHMAIHSGEKRFICNYCGRRFHVLFRLKEHIFKHTGEKPYKCTLCDKAFGTTALRKIHMRVHTGEKPFKCNFENCERAYAHTSDLKRHRRSVHGIILKTFECPICSKVFYENKFLTKHLNAHQEQI